MRVFSLPVSVTAAPSSLGLFLTPYVCPSLLPASSWSANTSVVPAPRKPGSSKRGVFLFSGNQFILPPGGRSPKDPGPAGESV